MMNDIFFALLVAAVVMIFAAIGWGVYSDIKSPVIEIKKDDWECTKFAQRMTFQSMVIGKAVVLQPISISVCVEYRMRAAA